PAAWCASPWRPSRRTNWCASSPDGPPFGQPGPGNPCASTRPTTSGITTMARNTIFRSMHDLGLAAWFGGTLAGAVALTPASGAAQDAYSTGGVANAGWDRWTPVNAAAIGAHLVGSVGELAGNRGRLAAQQGVATMSLVKTALTAGALGVTAYSRM